MIVALRNPDALRDPRIGAFVVEGFAAVAGSGYENGESLLVALWKELSQNENAGLLFDVEGDALLGFALLDGYCGPLRTFGWVTHLYTRAKGSRARLVAAGADWFCARGVYRVRTTNGLGVPGEMLVHFARSIGATASIVSEVIEVDFEGATHGGRQFVTKQDAGHYAGRHRGVPRRDSPALAGRRGR